MNSWYVIITLLICAIGMLAVHTLEELTKAKRAISAIRLELEIEAREAEDGVDR